MEQTFNDLLRERAGDERGLLAYALWLFLETSVGIFRENLTTMMMRHKRLIYTALATGLLLLVPVVGEWPWTRSDFLIAGALLFSTGLAFELLTRKGGNTTYRLAVSLALGAALLLTWMNLAVGIIGNENNPANLMYFGVLAVGIVGAVIARSRPPGMARALFATAITQALVPVIALVIWQPPFTAGVLAVFAVNGFFVLMFAGSALLFRSVRVAPTW
jgi:hypothetical protein